jgi:hypothetical protein
MSKKKLHVHIVHKSNPVFGYRILGVYMSKLDARRAASRDSRKETSLKIPNTNYYVTRHSVKGDVALQLLNLLDY